MPNYVPLRPLFLPPVGGLLVVEDAAGDVGGADVAVAQAGGLHACGPVAVAVVFVFGVCAGFDKVSVVVEVFYKNWVAMPVVFCF